MLYIRIVQNSILMATITYQLFSKTENAPICVRLSVNRKLRPRAKTGLHINPKDWGTKSFPKTNIDINKKLKSALQKLS